MWTSKFGDTVAKWISGILVLATACIIVFFCWSLVTCCPDKLEFSATYQGTWRSTDKDASFEATISDDAIEIVWINNAFRPLYWKGDFTSAIPTMEPVVRSRGDVEAMDASLLASTDTEKFFTYRDEKLSFRMTIAGVSTTIYMNKV